MKKRVIITAVILIVAMCVLVSCSPSPKGTARLLVAPAKAASLPYGEREDENFNRISESTDIFAARFASAAYGGTDGNFAVAPISAYMALALAAECSEGKVRDEILDVLGVDYESLSAGFSLLYRALNTEYKRDGKVVGRIALGNSIWLDDNNIAVKNDCINKLASNYFCYSYGADFDGDNKGANASLRNFVKDMTYGLIDKDFSLPLETVALLVNTLYIKDIWNSYGDDLSRKDGSFLMSNGIKKNTKLLVGYYNLGRAYVGDGYRMFFTTTAHGNKIKFFVPLDGYSVDDLFTEEKLGEINSVADFAERDDVAMLEYHTRCIFPEYTASYDDDIRELLKGMGIKGLFNEGKTLQNLTDDDVVCNGIQHKTCLKVDKKGLEGAAVTILEMGATSAPGSYKKVYEDFMVDRSFGFLVTDRFDTVLFSGAVKTI